MASDKIPDDNAAGPERPRRPPPTIDLEATEISSVRANASETAAPGDDANPGKQPEDGSPATKSMFLLKVFVASLAALVVVAAIWSTGWLSSLTPFAETRVAARPSPMEARPAPALPSLAPVTARIDAVESTLSGFKDALAALQKTVDATAASVNELKSVPRSAPQDITPALAPLNERLSRIEQSSRSAPASAPTADPRLRRAVAGIALDAMVRQGAPFADALAAAKQSGVETALLAPLESFAASGVPGDAALVRDLQKLLTPAAQPAAATKPDVPAIARDGSLIDRLTASAAKLVQVERVDTAGNATPVTAKSGDDRAGILARVQAAIRVNDVASAQRELARLSESDRAAFKLWLDMVSRRDAALEASRRLVAMSLAGLTDSANSSPSPASSRSAP